VTAGVYAIHDRRCGGVYVGESEDIERRWVGHRHEFNVSNAGPRAYMDDEMQTAWRNDTLSYVVLEELTCGERTYYTCSRQRLRQPRTASLGGHGFYRRRSGGREPRWGVITHG
jgi:hypothetical protein